MRKQTILRLPLLALLLYSIASCGKNSGSDEQLSNPLPLFESADGWLPYASMYVNVMDDHWKDIPYKKGTIDVKGCNYFILPAPRDGNTYSSHYDPESPFFQSFFGIYVIPPTKDGPVPMEVIPTLGERDNMAWLRFMGDADPESEPIDNSVSCSLETAGKCEKWKFVTPYAFSLDVGRCNPGNHAKDCPPLPPEIPEMWKAPPDAWKPYVVSYQDAKQLPTIQYAWYEGDFLFVNFMIGIQYTDKKGKTINTWESSPSLQEGLQNMATSMKIVDRKGDFKCATGI